MSAKLRFTFSERNNGTDVFLCSPVFGSKGALTDARGELGTNFGNLGVRQFGLGMAATMRMASFLVHVVMVVLASAKKQMGRIDTLAVITAMKYPNVIRQFAMSESPRKTMGANQFVASLFKHTVAAGINPTLPLPTVVGAAHGNLLPKAFCNGARGGGLMTANVLTLETREFGDGDELTASALAKNLGRGMICHVEKLLSAFGQAWDGGNRCQALCIAFLPVYFSTFELEMQYVLA